MIFIISLPLRFSRMKCCVIFGRCFLILGRIPSEILSPIRARSWIKHLIRSVLLIAASMYSLTPGQFNRRTVPSQGTTSISLNSKVCCCFYYFDIEKLIKRSGISFLLNCEQSISAWGSREFCAYVKLISHVRGSFLACVRAYPTLQDILRLHS